jgi:hypothetical protein
MIVVKFVKPWGPYNAGETAGFAPEQLKERLNVGSGPEQTERIPRGCYVGATDEQKLKVAELFSEAITAKVVEATASSAAASDAPAPAAADDAPATPTPPAS